MFKSNSKKDVTMEIMTLKANKIPNIYIDYIALLKMNQIVNTCSAEVGWLGSVNVTDDGYFITDVFLLEQKVTGVTTELDEKALSDLLFEMVNTDPEKYNSIKLWGHSHVNMTCTPSAQDDETFAEYYNNNPFFIRLIANKKEEMRIDIAIKEEGMIYKKVPWEVIYPEDIINALYEYEEANDYLKKAEQNVIEIKEKYENGFKESLNVEIKEKVTEDSKKYYNKSTTAKKEEKAVTPYQWTDDEMNEYGSWYDYYGYNEYYGYMDELMKKCDAGKKVLSRGRRVDLTEAFDAYEIVDLAECCTTWRDMQNYMKDDARTASYNKNDWKTLYDSIRKTYEEYERRMAS